MTEFFISGKVIPNASLAATYARGNPVALLASAELRDKRALTCEMRKFSIKMLPDYFIQRIFMYL